MFHVIRLDFAILNAGQDTGEELNIDLTFHHGLKKVSYIFLTNCPVVYRIHVFDKLK